MQWSPPAGQTMALAAVGVGLGLGAAVLDDAAGRVLLGAAALLALLLAARELVARPRLAARADGVEVRGLTGRRLLPWTALRVQVRATRRFGVRGRTLELDTSAGPDDAGELVVLGRWDLGTDPDQVAAALNSRTAP